MQQENWPKQLILTTDVSLNIKLFFKENHLDYNLWVSVHSFNKERKWGKLFTIKTV